MFDPSLDVAREAIRSAGRLRRRRLPLRAAARVADAQPPAQGAPRAQVLVGYGEEVVDALAYFLNDPGRRHLDPPARAVDAGADSVAAVARRPGHARSRTRTASSATRPGAAIERLRRGRPDLRLDPAVVERQILQETTRAFSALTLHYNLFVVGGLDADSLLARALDEKQRPRARPHLPPARPGAPAGGHRRGAGTRWRSPDARLRSGAIEYLDNLLTGDVRRRVMLLARGDAGSRARAARAT